LAEQENNQILNKRPPALTEDFGITDEEDKLAASLMPDKHEPNKNDKEKRR
jgi:hypothetical protein